MLSFGVIEKLDVVKDVCTILFAGCVGFSPNSLALEKLKEALGNSMIVAISPAAHAGFEIVSFKKRLPLMTGKLAPLDHDY